MRRRRKMKKTTSRFSLPRVPIPRPTLPHGGAKARELSSREELTLRLNEMHQDSDDDNEELRQFFAGHEEDDYFDFYGPQDIEDDYFNYLIDKLDNAGGDL
jgi:hypothetical protein